MTELWNPWGTQESNLFEMWLQAGILAGVVDEKRINYQELLKIVENAQQLELLGDMSRDQAILLTGLWMGRYQGNKDTGRWKPKYRTTETDVEYVKEACEDFIRVADEEGSKSFWEAIVRLLVSLRNIHPENVT